MNKTEPPIIKVPFDLKHDKERDVDMFIIDRDYIEIFSHRSERAAKILKWLHNSEVNHYAVINQIIVADIALNEKAEYISIGNLDHNAFINFTNLGQLIRNVHLKFNTTRDRFAITLFGVKSEETGFDTVLFDMTKKQIYVFQNSEAISDEQIEKIILKLKGDE